MTKQYPPELAKLIDAIITKAPLCLANKALLQGIDFSRLESGKVAWLLANLEDAGKQAPPWLLKTLLVSGHHIKGDLPQYLAMPYKFLNQLNDTATDRIDDLEQGAAELSGQKLDDSALAQALIKGLQAKGFDRQALALAQTNWQQFPKLLRLAAKKQKPSPKGLEAVRLDAAKLEAVRLDAVKLRILGFSTTNTLAQDLKIAFAAQGFLAHIDEANFGEAIPELLKPASQTYDGCILMLDKAGFMPRDERLDRKEAMAQLTSRIDLLCSALSQFASAAHYPIFINSLPLATTPTVGFLDSHHSDGETANLMLVNQRLSELAASQSQIILIDSLVALAAIAPALWFDAKLWFYGRIPYSAQTSRALSSQFAKAWHAHKKGPAKVLALDLDNTMWGGVFGEDGVHGLQCGDDFPGNAFKAMQHEYLRLKNQGMILVILSKNNPDAISAFEDHSDMVLKPDDFVAHAINWQPKPQNIRQMAKDLDVGLDSFIFLDDSPHEREAMRALCPEVFVPELPDDPASRPDWLRGLSQTWPILLTKEDAGRSAMYQANQQAKALQSSATSFEDYLSGLCQQLIITEVCEKTLVRAEQMHTRTNQFNLTTRRFDESRLKAMMEDDNHHVLLGQALDKFGDHGLVICATVTTDGQKAVIETMLMSCRVIGREVETAFLGALLAKLKAKGITQVTASYIPTAKNAQVSDFYSRHGLTKGDVIGDETFFHWDSQSDALPKSLYVKTQNKSNI